MVSEERPEIGKKTTNPPITAILKNLGRSQVRGGWRQATEEEKKVLPGNPIGISGGDANRVVHCRQGYRRVIGRHRDANH